MSKVYTRTFTAPDGRRMYFRGRTAKEAEQKRDEAKWKAERGLRINDTSTFAEVAELWFDTYKKGQMHIRSEETIEGTMRRYILPQLGWMQLKDIRPLQIQQLMSSIRQYSKSTQRKVLQCTRSIFLMAEENGYIAKSPVQKSVKAKGSTPDEKIPLTHEQSDTLLEAVRGTRAYPLVLILLHSGLRLGEALGLMWSDIDFDAGTITVNRSIVYPQSHPEGLINDDMKTDAAHRTIPVPEFVIEELKGYRAQSKSVYVFAMRNGHYLSSASYRSLWRVVEYRIVGRTNNSYEVVPRTVDFDVHPHLLRHTCITRWFESGLDIKEVQYLAGHADPSITLGIYTHYMAQERRKETAAKIRAVTKLTAKLCNISAT